MNNKNIKARAYEFMSKDQENTKNDLRLGYAFVKASPNFAIQPITFEEMSTVSPEYLFNFYGKPRNSTLSRYRRKFLEENPIKKPNNEDNTRATSHSKQLRASSDSLFTRYK